MTKFVARLRGWDAALDRELPLLVLLLVLVVLRLPNFLEPVWYGDEAIYLTIGNALRQGATLYTDIVDHKTPVIYLLSLVPDQFSFRVLLTGWMIVTTIAFYHLSLKIFSRLGPAFLATLTFVILTSIPAFEGNIPNGELFVIGFVMVAALLLSYTKFYSGFFEDSRRLASGQLSLAGLRLAQAKQVKSQARSLQQALADVLTNTHDAVLYLAAGLLLGLAVLTKVPAVFDAVALISVSWFTLTNAVPNRWPWTKQQFANWRRLARQVLARTSLIGVGMAAAIAASIGYFALLGAVPDYLEFGLLYNFRYSQAFGLPFDGPLLVGLFSLGGKAALAGGLVGLLTILRGRVRPAFQFAASWLVLALFAALLSNRPYPHYFQQVVPGLALSGGLVVGLIGQHLGWAGPAAAKKSAARKSSQLLKYRRYLLAETTIGLVLLAGLWQVLQLLQVGFYPTLSYYRRSLEFVGGQLSRTDYFNSFDALTADNYRAAAIIAGSQDPQLFIWGTNAPLYALTGKVPPGRFTVSFHVKDFNAFDETFQAVEQHKPAFIVVMDNERDNLPGLNELLINEYIPNRQFDHFILWRKQSAVAPI